MTKMKVEVENGQAVDQAEAAKIAARTAEDRLADDILVLDVSKSFFYADYFVICSGNTTRHTSRIAEEVQRKMKEAGVRLKRAEGAAEATWILLDFGDVIVHIFTSEAREFYKLENLWKDAPRLEFKT